MQIFALQGFMSVTLCTPLIHSPKKNLILSLVDLIEEVSDLVSISFQKSRSENMKGNEKD